MLVVVCWLCLHFLQGQGVNLLHSTAFFTLRRNRNSYLFTEFPDTTYVCSMYCAVLTSSVQYLLGEDGSHARGGI